LTYYLTVDSIGVTPFRSHEMRLVWVFSLLRGLGVLLESLHVSLPSAENETFLCS